MEIATLPADEVARLRELFPEAWDGGAVLVEAVRWSSSGATHRKLTFHGAHSPTTRIWIFRSTSDVDRPEIETRPATPAEIETLLSALRELGYGSDIRAPLAEAHAQPESRRFEVSFVPVERMSEGAPYRRWYFRLHADAPTSVAYVVETRRGGELKTCPGGRVVRGEPW